MKLNKNLLKSKQLLTTIIVLLLTFIFINGIFYYLFSWDLLKLLKGTSFCLFYNLTGYQCPGCGMTGAFIAIGRGNFVLAWGYNPFSLILLIMMIVYLLPYKNFLPKIIINLTLGLLIILALIFVIYRNLF